jgi:hypothetical protein
MKHIAERKAWMARRAFEESRVEDRSVNPTISEK